MRHPTVSCSRVEHSVGFTTLSWEKVLHARVSKQPRVIPAYCAHLCFANHRSLVLNFRGQRMERNFSPWQLFLKSSLRGAHPWFCSFPERTEAGYAAMITVIDVKGVRESGVPCVGPEIILFPPFSSFFSFTLFIHSKFGILNTFCKLQFFKVIRIWRWSRDSQKSWNC